MRGKKRFDVSDILYAGCTQIAALKKRTICKSKSDNKKWMQVSTEVWVELYR